MIKATSFCSGEMTLHGWISIIWLSSAVSIAGSQDVELHTTPEVLGRCGDNVTLTCNAISSQKQDIKLFAWLGRNKTVCKQDEGQLEPDVLCETTATAPHELKVTLINVMPVHRGQYLCKLQSNVGATSAQSFLSVQDCLKSSDFSIKGSYAECWFTGVYPRGTVHWFQGDSNLTDSAITQEKEDQHGRYDVWSKIMIEKGKSSQAYNCSLWMLDDRKYLFSQHLYVPEELKLSGTRVQLQWICIMAEILVFKSMV